MLSRLLCGDGHWMKAPIQILTCRMMQCASDWCRSPVKLRIPKFATSTIATVGPSDLLQGDRAMQASQHSGQGEPCTSMCRLSSSNRLSVGRPVGASPARLPSSCPRAQRSGRSAQPQPCRAATMTAPPQTSQSGAGDGRQNSMQDAARRSELAAERTLTRAVVIGGSIAGMFASAACAAHFDEVRPTSDLVVTRHH